MSCHDLPKSTQIYVRLHSTNGNNRSSIRLVRPQQPGSLEKRKLPLQPGRLLNVEIDDGQLHVDNLVCRLVIDPTKNLLGGFSIASSSNDTWGFGQPVHQDELNDGRNHTESDWVGTQGVSERYLNSRDSTLAASLTQDTPTMSHVLEAGANCTRNHLTQGNTERAVKQRGHVNKQCTMTSRRKSLPLTWYQYTDLERQ